MQVISSLVDLQTDVIEDDTMKEMLKEIKQRVHSMALVHEKLYHSGNLANVEFADYTNSLLNSLWRTHKTEKLNVRLDTALEPIHLPVTMAVPCGLILNELISNAFTHAFRGRESGKVSITLGVDDGNKARLTVRDDGIGLPFEKDWRQANTLGLRLVQMLAKQLHAAVDVRNDSGTEFIISFEGPKS
jgi:two-component sensor histidine kinase